MYILESVFLEKDDKYVFKAKIRGVRGVSIRIFRLFRQKIRSLSIFLHQKS